MEKRLAICCLVLAVAAMLAPKSRAATHCITFADFCDKIQYSNTKVGGEQGVEVVGLWDWQCDGVSLLILSGSGGQKLKIGTSLGTAHANWTLNKKDGLADLYETLDGVSESPVQTNAAWSVSSGSCGFSHANGKPSILSMR